MDALLVGEDALSQLFDFSYVYFMVTHPVPSAVVAFLQSLMPARSTADLYSAIGYHKHGKTVFYRDFLHHLKYSDDELIIAPGIRGMVMAVFTLPSYPYVFKVIRDRFAPPKEIERKTVERKYQLVKQHDRVGRMADMLEYSYVALPKHRFSEDLLQELETLCSEGIEFENDQLVIKHVYIERRMIPLDIDLADARPGPESNLLAREVLLEVVALPEAQRATVMLVYVEGYSYKQASEILEIPIGTVMSRLAAARSKLASKFDHKKSSLG